MGKKKLTMVTLRERIEPYRIATIKLNASEQRFLDCMSNLIHTFINSQLEEPKPDPKNYKGTDWSEVG